MAMLRHQLIRKTMVTRTKILTDLNSLLLRSQRRFFTERSHDTSKWLQPQGGYDSGLQIYNCTVRDLVPLIFRSRELATWYQCGPTVYADSHIGHASCYVKLDILQRIMRDHMGIHLVTAMNITDIDDKILKRSAELGMKWHELATMYERKFWLDLRKLNVLEPNLKVRVSDHMPKIIDFVESIHEKGNAYKATDQSVYFKVNAYPEYGKLQTLNLEEMNSTSLNAVEQEHFKHCPLDFALWKAQKSPNEPSWPSQFGPGRPGWHIECSALATMLFGDTVDIHAGGFDLRFPHHENEEAQSCVYHNKSQWVNYWIHTGQLMLKGDTEKMSKSLGNTVTIDEMLQSYSSDTFRMACALSHYRKNMEFSPELMKMAKNVLERFENFHLDCQAYVNGPKDTVGSVSEVILRQALNETRAAIHEALMDDFDTASAMGCLLTLTSMVRRAIHSNPSKPIEAQTTSSLDVIAAVDMFVVQQLDKLGFMYTSPSKQLSELKSSVADLDLNGLIDDILRTRRIIRDEAKQQKNKALFAVCDELRNMLSRQGIHVRDHKEGGTSWSFLEQAKHNKS